MAGVRNPVDEPRADRVSIVTRRWPGVVDLALVGGIAVYAAALLSADGRRQSIGSIVTLVLVCVVVCFRRVAPELALALLAGVRIWQYFEDAADAYVSVALFVLLFTVASLRSTVRSLLAFAAVSAVFIATARQGWLDSFILGSTFGYFGLAVACGASVRHQHSLNEDLRQQAAEIERAAEEREIAAINEERARLRDDLHDFLGHRLNLVLVLAESGKVEFERGPERVPESLSRITRAARSALEEMDRTTRLLGVAVSAAPTPTLLGYEDLIATIRGTGVEVNVVSAPQQSELARLDMVTSATAFRVLQEALTNVLKHSLEQWASVEIRLGVAAVELNVTSGRVATATQPRRTGTGLTNLQRRLDVLGGSLAWTDTGEGTFVLEAVIPWSR
ncbi:sensor histidine kinase [Desertimonas flava]|uniref:sensor histidine kinase n=1 Tax=Desertimonas flava TaxID=2064846 RepID=UPI0013C50CE6|nr:histidine kinase [Desertimonas flava]